MTSLAHTKIASQQSTSAIVWTRIASEISEAISKGVYAPGQRLPTERVLAEKFGVNRHTVRRSLAKLCNQGVLRVTQGSGTYVQDCAVELLLGKRPRLQTNLELAGLTGGFKVLKSRSENASKHIAMNLAVPIRSKILHLTIVAGTEHVPLSFSERYFPLPRFLHLDDLVRNSGSISSAFLSCGVKDYTRLTSRISAQMPDEATAQFLKQSVQSPVLLVESVNIDSEGVPIEYCKSWFSGDRVSLTVHRDD
jgi:GntR family phosphonate transport system transcriptional regulator